MSKIGMVRAAVLATVAASVATLFAAAPAATAAPSAHIKTVSGAAAYHRAAEEAITFEYTPYFYARSAMVEGTLYTDTCVRVYASTYAGPSRRLDRRSTSLKCATSAVKFELKADIPGGADRILFEIRNAADALLASWWEYR